MDSAAGIVVLAVVVLWLAYMVPQRLRHRQQLLESRVDDRFSGRLRVLAVATAGTQAGAGKGRGQSAVALHSHGDCTTSSSADVSLLTPPHGMQVRPRRYLTDGEQDMERQEERASSPHLDALHARRAAAARRRALLSFGLLLLTVGLAVASSFTALPLWSAVISGVLLLLVLVLGRRAVVAGARADAARDEREAAAGRRAPTARGAVAPTRRAGRPAPAVRPAVTGRAVRPSQSHTQMIARVSAPTSGRKPEAAPVAEVITLVEPAQTSEPAAEEATPVVVEVVAAGAGTSSTATPVSSDADETAEKEWQPVAVPRPVYVTKASAPRWEPAPLTAELRQLTEARRAELAETYGDVVEEPETTEEAPDDSLGVNLNSVLARRRVAGE